MFGILPFLIEDIRKTFEVYIEWQAHTIAKHNQIQTNQFQSPSKNSLNRQFLLAIQPEVTD